MSTDSFMGLQSLVVNEGFATMPTAESSPPTMKSHVDSEGRGRTEEAVANST